MATPAPLWTDDETADVWLAWEHFHVLHPERDHSAWLNKRLREKRKLRESQAANPEPKPAPVLRLEPPTDSAALLDAALIWQSAINKAFPHTLEHQVSLEAHEPIAIAFMSDLHIGAEGCDLDRIISDCNLIASHPRLYVTMGGDPTDNFILSKMASAARSQSLQVMPQWVLFRHVIQLLHPSLLWVSSGNHDAWTQMVAGIDGVPATLAGIPVVYTGEGGYIDVRVGQQTYTFWRKHRPTRFNSQLNKTHFLKQMMRIELERTPDIAISEHFHEAGVELWNYKGQQRVLINCGSYKTMDRWAESGGFYSGGYGVPTIVVYPDRRKVLAFFSIEDALEVLDGTSLRPAA